MTVIILDESQIRFLDSHSNIINGEWYFIPFWFKKLDDKTFEPHHLEKLPESLKKTIEGFRGSDLPLERMYSREWVIEFAREVAREAAYENWNGEGCTSLNGTFEWIEENLK